MVDDLRGVLSEDLVDQAYLFFVLEHCKICINGEIYSNILIKDLIFMTCISSPLSALGLLVLIAV